MNAMAGFFGARADAVLALYRRAEADQQAAAQVAERLRELRGECEDRHRRDDAEIEQRTVRLAECTARLEEIERRLARLNALRDQLTLTLGSFWRRLGITLRRWFSKGSPSVDDLRDRLLHAVRGARKAEAQREKLARSQQQQSAQVRQLTVPLESVEFAISYLERLQQNSAHRARAHHAAVEAEIRAVVRASSLPLLHSKLNALPPGVDRRALATRVLRLKTLLLQALPESPEEPPLAELESDCTSRLTRAIEAGFSTLAVDGQASLTLRGEGRKHIRRKRLGVAMPRPGHGQRRLGQRNEPTWQQVAVQLAGTVPVALEIRQRRWRSEPVIQALRDEAQLWFRTGAASVAAEDTPSQQREVDELTAEIREILE